MNTITREDIIKALLNEEFDIRILEAYCKEHDKEDANISKFIHALFTNIILLNYCYSIALEYFQIKFEIIFLHDKFTNLITIY